MAVDPASPELEAGKGALTVEEPTAPTVLHAATITLPHVVMAWIDIENHYHCQQPGILGTVAIEMCITDSHPVSRPRKSRRRLWEIHHGHHCAILGTCLSLKATKKILRKAGVRHLGGASDYEVHCAAVDLAQRDGIAARLLDKALERAHQRRWAVYRRLSTVEEIRAQWQADVEANELAAGFWAVLHHPASDEALIKDSFGVVHMLSHQVGGSRRDRLKKFDDMEAELRNVRAQLARSERAHQAKVRQLEQALVSKEQELLEQQLQTQSWRSAAEAGDIERVRTLEEERFHRIRALARSERHLRYAKDTIGQLRTQLRALEEAENGAADVTAAPTRTPSPSPTDDVLDEGTPPCACDLEGCTVLYVGGEKRLLPHLKRVTVAANARLLHHDGGIEDNIRTLPRLCARADIVLCPINKVGHSAVGHVKRSCAESCKLFVPLRRASLEAFSSGLSFAASHREGSADRAVTQH